MTTTVQRIYNFSAGPAVLPVSVLEEAQRDLVALPGVGMSVLEISHRSKTFEDILARTEADLRTLGGIPPSHKVLFLQGGASLQFSMVPMNLLTAGSTADYIVTGGWAQKAVKEAQRVGTVNIAASTESENFSRLPTQDELTLTPDAAYVHFTTNNTLVGTEWRGEPAVGDVPLVADASSDIFSRPIDVARYGLIYAGAQKNLGPSGVTLVIIREDLLARSAKSLAPMLNYAVHAENGSMYNTPPCFGIYLMGLVAKWGLSEGGLAELGTRNERKAATAVRRDRSLRVLSRNGREGIAIADERHVPPAERGSREGVRQGLDGGRPRRSQGSSLGRRDARVDLQRVPRRRASPRWSSSCASSSERTDRPKAEGTRLCGAASRPRRRPAVGRGDGARGGGALRRRPASALAC